MTSSGWGALASPGQQHAAESTATTFAARVLRGDGRKATF